MFPPKDLNTHVTLWMDRRETFQTSNTGHFIQVALKSWSIYVFARRTQPMDTSSIPPERTLQPGFVPVVLFDRPDAPSLRSFAAQHSQPIQLIVPDATWRGAGKMVKRVPLLAKLPCVRLDTTPAQRPDPFIRQPPRTGAFSTLGAIARALGILEGQEMEDFMLRLLTTAVERHRWACGDRDRSRYQTPLPERIEGPLHPASDPFPTSWMDNICAPGRMSQDARMSLLFQSSRRPSTL